MDDKLVLVSVVSRLKCVISLLKRETPARPPMASAKWENGRRAICPLPSVLLSTTTTAVWVLPSLSPPPYEEAHSDSSKSVRAVRC